MPSPDPHTLHVQQLFVSHQTSLKASVLALEPRMAEAEDGGPFGSGRQSLLRRFRGDWPRILREHLYVRYAGAARDHARNKAFAERWQEKQPLAPLAARRSAGGPGACEREPGLLFIISFSNIFKRVRKTTFHKNIYIIFLW